MTRRRYSGRGLTTQQVMRRIRARIAARAGPPRYRIDVRHMTCAVTDQYGNTGKRHWWIGYVYRGKRLVEMQWGRNPVQARRSAEHWIADQRLDM